MRQRALAKDFLGLYAMVEETTNFHRGKNPGTRRPLVKTGELSDSMFTIEQKYTGRYGDQALWVTKVVPGRWLKSTRLRSVNRMRGAYGAAGRITKRAASITFYYERTDIIGCETEEDMIHNIMICI